MIHRSVLILLGCFVLFSLYFVPVVLLCGLLLIVFIFVCCYCVAVLLGTAFGLMLFTVIHGMFSAPSYQHHSATEAPFVADNIRPIKWFILFFPAFSFSFFSSPSVAFVDCISHLIGLEWIWNAGMGLC